MGYSFFVSYTRANNDSYLQQFIKDLSDAVRDRRPAPTPEDVRFFDQSSIELGEEWDHAIVEGLQTSDVVLALFSPAYFKSSYCGKELSLFRSRIAAGGSPEALIKPVIWIPFEPDSVPSALRAGQYSFGDPQAIQNRRGFKYLLKQLQEHRTQYNDLIEALAEKIVESGKVHPLPPLNPVEALASVPSLFDDPGGQTVAGPVGAIAASGPKHVHVVYVAADPNAFGNARSHDAYVDSGGADWKPFFPVSKTRVDQFVQNVVSAEDVGFTSEVLPFGADLINQIEAAWQRRQIVVLLVDGWSLNWSKKYRDVLSQLDARLDYHWCVLVPWNEQDAESMANRVAIEQSLSRTFDRHANLLPNPMFYRSGIRSTDELKTALREVLTRLKEEIRKRAPVDMPIPVGPPKSVLTGPSG